MPRMTVRYCMPAAEPGVWVSGSRTVHTERELLHMVRSETPILVTSIVVHPPPMRLQQLLRDAIANALSNTGMPDTRPAAETIDEMIDYGVTELGHWPRSAAIEALEWVRTHG